MRARGIFKCLSVCYKKHNTWKHEHRITWALTDHDINTEAWSYERVHVHRNRNYAERKLSGETLPLNITHRAHTEHKNAQKESKEYIYMLPTETRPLNKEVLGLMSNVTIWYNWESCLTCLQGWSTERERLGTAIHRRASRKTYGVKESKCVGLVVDE